MWSWLSRTSRQPSKTRHDPWDNDAPSGASVVPYWLFIAVVLAVFGLGWRVTPSVHGIGTHEQLGLPPCGFYTFTGIPCPSCGLTTSVSGWLHGEVRLAFWSQPFGIIVLLVLVWGLWLSVVGICTKRALTELIHPATLEKIQMGLLVLFLLSWITKLTFFSAPDPPSLN